MSEKKPMPKGFKCACGLEQTHLFNEKTGKEA